MNDRELIFVATRHGLEYVGEYDAQTMLTEALGLRRARKLTSTVMPVATPQGPAMARNLDLVPLYFADPSIERVDIPREDILIAQPPGQHVQQAYMRAVYKLESATPGQSKIISG